MPFKSISHLARLSFAKSVTHAYTPGAVVAGQQGIGTLHQLPVGKLSKAAHLQNAFSTASGSSAGAGAGAGAKAGHASSSASGGDSLTQYFAAFTHAQQTGDDTELKKHQVARHVGWKQAEKSSGTKPTTRLDAVKPADILRQPVRQTVVRSQSGNPITTESKTQDTSAEDEALAKIDEAIAQEIQSPKVEAVATAVPADIEHGQDVDSYEVESVQASASEGFQSPTSSLSSPFSEQSSLRSDEIVESGEQSRFAEIPYQFQSMVKEGLTPNVHAYNYIIQSAITLAGGYQPFPRAVEVFNDMTAKGVQPNADTYRILITFLASQSVLASQAQKELKQHSLRYGKGQGSFTLASQKHKAELFSDDVSIIMATKFYNIARQEIPSFRLSDAQYATFLQAYKLSGAASSMAALSMDMHSQQVLSSPENCIAAIDGCAQAKDLTGAKAIYQQYRSLAINGSTTDTLDNQAYTALIRAYYACGEEEEGLRFFERIVESYAHLTARDALVGDLTDTFVSDGLVQHYLESGNFHQALETIHVSEISEAARARAISKVLASAADNDQVALVTKTLKTTSEIDLTDDTVIAISAMHFRAGEILQAQTFWSQQGRVADVGFAIMYALSVFRTGNFEMALSQVLAMFRQMRRPSSGPLRGQTFGEIDEAVTLLGQTLAPENMVYSSQAAVLLFRIMIESGGLVPFITQAAIARIGPECVQQMSEQDIALALHVQALMLPTSTHATNDIAQAARFSHLLETVLDRRIGMDPATIHAVDVALPRLGGARVDLERRWNAWRSPETTPAQLASPVAKQTSQEPHNSAQMMDPYGHTTDHRASRAIVETLESTSGRPESHLNEALGRLKNVRRMGRHLQYSAYAKLITAAGKTKQSSLMHEILNMAQTDVPFTPLYPAVRNGWVTIYDSMIAACLTVGDRKLAARFHNEVLTLGAAPSANTFGIYITTLEGTLDEATEAVQIFQRAMAEGVTPTVFLFNAVIGKLGKARRIDDCLQYFGQMQNLGIRPSSVTYGTLVNALCRTSEEAFAVEMFDEMESAPNYRPRPAPYNSIIQYFLNTKRDRSKVLQYYNRMQSKNIRPTSHTYKLLIESYASLEPVDLSAAEAVLKEMKSNGVAPEAVHYGSLIHAKGCVLSDIPGARAIFDSVLADPSIKPTDNLYQNILEAMVANHKVIETDAILDDMFKRGISMTPYIANTLIHGWAGTGNIQKARQIYNSLGVDKREPSTYEAMTRAFLAADEHGAAKAVVEEMLSKGYPSAVADKVLGLITYS